MNRSVLFIQNQSFFGADSFVHSLLMRGLPDLGYEVHVAADPGTEAKPSQAYDVISRIPSVRMVPSRFGKTLSHTRTSDRIRRLGSLPGAALTGLDLVRYVRKNRIGIVHATEKPRDVVLATSLASFTSARSVIHLHVKCHESLSPITTFGLRRADAIVGVSEFVRRTIVEAGYPPDRTHAILNAIDVDAWQPEPCDRASVIAEFGFPEDAAIVVIAARIFSWKGHELLLDALGRIQSSHPNLRLLIVGLDDPRADSAGEPMSLRLRRQANALGLGEQVTFTGFRSDMRRLLGACDVFAMPSFEEPFGLVYAEAAAMGKPVVALDNGGAPEVVRHETTGLLSPPGDVQALAGNLDKLLRDPKLRRCMGEAGRTRVNREFTIERLCRDFLHLYSTLV